MLRHLIAYCLAIFCCACAGHKQEKQYRIGFSQCTFGDAWRQSMQKEVARELSFHPEIELIVKDAKSFYHYTSALTIKGFHPNESPPAKLHFFIMQDCFYNEQKKFYNISFGGSDNLIRFKELFNPIEIERPPYYTFVIKKNTLHLFSNLSLKYTTDLRNFFKSIDKRFRRS